MMGMLRALLLALLIQGSFVGAVFPGHNNRGHDDGPALRHTDTNGPCECMLVQVHALYPEGHGNNGHTVDDENGGWRCVDPTGGHQDMFSLKDLPADFVKTNKIEASDSGNSYLSISSATKRRVRRRRNNDGDDDQDDEANMISIHPGAKVSIKRGVEESRRRLDEGGRRLVQAGDPRGARALLVVRVRDSIGDAPSLSASQLASDIFSDRNNLRSQYRACSGGLVDFRPATGPNIANGVYELSIPQRVSGVASSTVQAWVDQKMDTLNLGTNQYTHIIYILPQSVDFNGAAAYAFVGFGKAVFWNSYASTLLVLVHELGHNLKQLHSGEGSLAYGDRTCMMGAHIYADDVPQMCFNGAKSWYFGWYSDRHKAIDPRNGHWNGKLVGIDDYLKKQTSKNEHTVVAKIGTLFVMYNRKEGVNSEVAGNGDTVTIVEQAGPQQQSWKRAALTESSTPFRQRNWGGTNKDLVIQVCERRFGTPDYATVLVYLEGSSNPSCADAGQTSRSNSFDCRNLKRRRVCFSAKTSDGTRRCRWTKRKGQGRCQNK